VVAHLGGGISVGAHLGGKVVDVADAGEGYGPFTPQRAGTVGTEVMLNLCYDKGLTRDEVFRMIRGGGGLMAYLGTDDLREVEARVDAGDKEAELVMETMFYQIAKEIGYYATVLKFDVEAILLTGGLAYSKRLTSRVSEYVGKIAPIVLYPGEFENEALAAGAYRVLSGQEKPIIL
jgi:butyrate kinase